MRALLALLLLSLFPSVAAGQIFEVQFKTEKLAKKYAKYMVEVNGTPMLIGEIRSGMTYDRQTGCNWDNDKRSEWFLPNSNDPLSLPYKVKDGIKGKANKKQVVGIQNLHIKRTVMFAENNSFYGISLEYKKRLGVLDSLREKRDEFDEGGREWKAAHWALLDSYDGLSMWLTSLGFTGAEKKISKEAKRQRKVVSKAAEAARSKRAIENVGKVKAAKDANATAERVGLKVRFKVQESQHCRIIYRTGIKDVQVEHCLKMAERAIAGFRAKFVEPYLAEDFVDRIPENLWIEWYFGPMDATAHEKMYEEHFGMSWGPRKEERVKLDGSRNYRGGENAQYLCYWRNEHENALTGIVANNLGVHLATLHYGTANTQVPMHWIEQAVGYWVSLEYLGRNTVTEKAFDWGQDDGHTVSRSGPEEKDKETVAETPLAIGEKHLYLQSALAEGVPFNVLMRTRLFDMKRGDVAKSWAMFDFLTRTRGKEAQLFLRSMGKFAREGGPFQEKLRKVGDPLFKNKGQDLFRRLDELWEEFAKKEVGGV